MKVLLSGGGSGGHITPLLAVAHELKKIKPQVRIVYVGERGGKFADLVQGSDVIDEIHFIPAGKFRRYHGESWGRRLLDIRTFLLNVRDAFRFFFGTIKSLFLIHKIKPDVVLLKGGFVGVPVGYAAAFWHVPFVTHDSDATAGLANRIVSKWAACHATALPANFYAYPQDKTRYVGPLVGEAFQAITPALQAQYKAELSLAKDGRLLLVTGGSLGAQRLNKAFSSIANDLLKHFDNLTIVHQVGKGGEKVYKQYANKRLIVLPFLSDMHRYTGAADVIVARAGANTLAELGLQGKATIVVPNAELAGGHQLKNAQKLADQDAIVMIKEKTTKQDATALKKAIDELLRSPKKRQQLGAKLREISPTGAAHKLAMLLLEVQSHNGLAASKSKKS